MIIRRCTAHATLFIVGCTLASAVLAQTYPARPIRYIVSGSPGSGTDTLARIVADRMGQVLNQQIIVENRPGGGSNIA